MKEIMKMTKNVDKVSSLGPQETITKENSKMMKETAMER